MKKKLQLYTLVFTIFADFIGFSLVIAIFPPIILHNSPALLSSATSEFWRNTILGLLTASYPMAQFFGAPFFGVLSDTHGRKRIMLLTLLGSAISYVFTAIALMLPSLVLLFASRILAGLFAGNLTLAQAAIGDLSNDHTRVKNFALVSAAGGLAFIVGPMIGADLTNASIVSWFQITTPFWIAALLFFITLIAFSQIFTESHRQPIEKKKLSLLAGSR